MPEHTWNLQEKVSNLTPWFHPPGTISYKCMCPPNIMPKSPCNVILATQALKICDKKSQNPIKIFHPKKILRVPLKTGNSGLPPILN